MNIKFVYSVFFLTLYLGSYATLCEYYEDGKLIRLKKETERENDD